jgi:cathepsin B
MKFILAILASAIFASIVDEINNNPKATWKAIEYPPEVINLESLKLKLIRPWRAHSQGKIVGRYVSPDSFDARTQWPNLILPVRDQGNCGSCWAFAVAETVGDRVGIAAGKSNGVYSPQDLISCDFNNYGCDGGYVDYSWDYVLQNGLALEACIPYTSGDGSEPPCPSKCTNGSAIVRTKAKSVYPVRYAIMQTELQTNGPYEVAFDVYEDFMDYVSGVYQHLSGDLLGGHAVKVIGWGTDGGLPYWLVQNSWGTSWGIQGFFEILRGQDECGIEDSAYCGTF